MIRTMEVKKRYLRGFLFVFCAIVLLSLNACQSSRNQIHAPSKYKKVRTRHTPKWNATTSQSTTYYIKKNATRKSHDGKTMKYKPNKQNKSRSGKTSKR